MKPTTERQMASIGDFSFLIVGEIYMLDGTWYKYRGNSPLYYYFQPYLDYEHNKIFKTSKMYMRRWLCVY